jgi:hypothetical protein
MRVACTAEVWNLLANMLRYSGYLDKGFFHSSNAQMNSNTFKNYKKLIIPPSKQKSALG